MVLTYFMMCLKPPRWVFILCNLISWSSRVFSFFNYSQLGYGTLLSGSIP
uniref:Uncharacterized protein n=1 Tax=Ailuropoda melanoleuca TaxID=9646 RepID=A0A7N5KFZ4_AILME